MRMLPLLAMAFILLPISACKAEDDRLALQRQCEQDFAKWQDDQDVPESCYRHLEMLKSAIKPNEGEDHLVFVERVKNDLRYNIHFNIKNTLSEVCLKQEEVIDGDMFAPSGSKCKRAFTYEKLLRYEPPGNYEHKNTFTIPSEPPAIDNESSK